MNKSDDISLLAAALVKAQPMVEGAKKDSLNPHFRSKYADLGSVWDAISDALEKNDLAISQFPDETSQGLPALTTMLLHKSGQWLSATYPLISVKQDPQGFASAQTYARRYGLSAVMGVISEDDDGEGASRAAKPAPAKTQAEAIHTPHTMKPETQEKPHNAGPVTPAQWLENSAKAVKTMTREQLDRFTDEQGARMVRVQTLNPSLHKALMDAIQLRQAELF